MKVLSSSFPMTFFTWLLGSSFPIWKSSTCSRRHRVCWKVLLCIYCCYCYCSCCSYGGSQLLLFADASFDATSTRTTTTRTSTTTTRIKSGSSSSIRTAFITSSSYHNVGSCNRNCVKDISKKQLQQQQQQKSSWPLLLLQPQFVSSSSSSSSSTVLSLSLQPNEGMFDHLSNSLQHQQQRYHYQNSRLTIHRQRRQQQQQQQHPQSTVLCLSKNHYHQYLRDTNNDNNDKDDVLKEEDDYEFTMYFGRKNKKKTITKNNNDKETNQNTLVSQKLNPNQAMALHQLLSLFVSNNNNEAYNVKVQDLYNLNLEQARAVENFASSFSNNNNNNDKYSVVDNKKDQNDNDYNNDYFDDDNDDDDSMVGYNSITVNNMNDRIKKDKTSSSSSSADPILSPKQQLALDLIKQGHNVFITGAAGTGKSLVLHLALEYLETKYSDDKRSFVAVAPTGTTALALGGQTIHSFSGVGVPKTQDSFRKTRTKKDIAKKWKELKVMIMDECSMISGEFMDRLSREVSMARNNDSRPFGGIQLVFCGDFLQLPPIQSHIIKRTAKQEREAMERKGQDPNELFLNRGFCFQSHAWEEANFKMVELDVVFRQQSNHRYISMLQDIRKGRVTSQASQFLRECQRPIPPNPYGIRPTMLHSKNIDVFQENMRELDKLEGDAQRYRAVDTIHPESSSSNSASTKILKQLYQNPFFKNCIAEKELPLKVGAQVMLCRNMPRHRLVNGSRGQVIYFSKKRKSRSSSSSTNNNNNNRNNDSGNNDGDDNNDDDDSIPANVIEPDYESYPVVQFVNGVKTMITPAVFESRILGLGTCRRIAIPLKLAWAVTTHKAQGLTLDYVIADVGNVFGEAQTYVALSRATSQEGLEIRNFSSRRVKCNAIASEFYNDPYQIFPKWDENEERRQTTTPAVSSAAAATTTRTSRSKQGQTKKKPNLKMTKKTKDPSNNIPVADSDSIDDGNNGRGIRDKNRNKNNNNNVDPSLETSILDEYTVPQLKEMLKARGLRLTGKKSELITRLRATS